MFTKSKIYSKITSGSKSVTSNDMRLAYYNMVMNKNYYTPPQKYIKLFKCIKNSIDTNFILY